MASEFDMFCFLVYPCCLGLFVLAALVFFPPFFILQTLLGGIATDAYCSNSHSPDSDVTCLPLIFVVEFI